MSTMYGAMCYDLHMHHFNLFFQEPCEDDTIAVLILSRGKAEANLNK